MTFLTTGFFITILATAYYFTRAIGEALWVYEEYVQYPAYNSWAQFNRIAQLDSTFYQDAAMGGLVLGMAILLGAMMVFTYQDNQAQKLTVRRIHINES